MRSAPSIGHSSRDSMCPSIEAMPDGQSAAPISRIAQALRSGMHLMDRDFDALLPRELRIVSSQYWTPISVIRMALNWIDAERVERVLDVGSGAGKFCVAGALGSSRRFVGVEHRQRLFEAARDLAERTGAGERATFLNRRVSALDLPAFDAVYLFNPFGENLFRADEWLDDGVELGEDRFRADVGIVEEGLARMRKGGLLLTYHGFGGRIPNSFSIVRQAAVGSDVLRMWKKMSSLSDGGFWLELDDGALYRGSRC
jgi:SAM-dependent methyltransferase